MRIPAEKGWYGVLSEQLEKMRWFYEWDGPPGTKTEKKMMGGQMREVFLDLRELQAKCMWNWEISEEPLKHHIRAGNRCKFPPKPDNTSFENSWSNSPSVYCFLLPPTLKSFLLNPGGAEKQRDWHSSLLQSSSSQKTWTEEGMRFKFKWSS